MSRQPNQNHSHSSAGKEITGGIPVQRGNSGFNPELSSPIHYRPPSPWTAASPPTIISGPRLMNPSNMRSPITIGTSPTPPPMLYGTNRSNQNSPMFGASGLRGTRGTNLPCPRPQWPTGQQQQSTMPPQPPLHFNPQQQFQPLHQQHNYQPSSSPSPIVINRQQSTYTPTNSTAISSYSDYPTQYEYMGAPVEPPNPKSYIVYDEEEESGLSTAEIIANQSQDYVDEKLAEYQMTIFQLQGEF